MDLVMSTARLVSKVLAIGAATIAAAGGCVERAQPAAPPYGVRGPPLFAWLERDAGVLTVTVVPTARLGGPIAIEVRARGRVRDRLSTRGGRLVIGEQRPGDALEIEVTWQDPGGVAGARVVMHDPDDPETVAPSPFESIERLDMGRNGPSIEQAVRIR